MTSLALLWYGEVLLFFLYFWTFYIQPWIAFLWTTFVLVLLWWDYFNSYPCHTKPWWYKNTLILKLHILQYIVLKLLSIIFIVFRTNFDSANNLIYVLFFNMQKKILNFKVLFWSTYLKSLMWKDGIFSPICWCVKSSYRSTELKKNTILFVHYF